MSILFFEGLPRAGKSYEAMVTQIIPALQKGREVVAYIECLDYEKIAAVAGLQLERVQELLHQLTRDDMRNVETTDERGRKVLVDGPWIRKTRDNALHVFDEAQNWWPNRHKASDALTQFVTEHGHRGIDILLMGQSLPDVLALWRRRVEQRLTFEKLTALGAENRYQVTVYKGRGNDEFTKVGSTANKYDKKYFGTYASHVSTETNTANYVDPRIKVWNSPAIKWGIPIALGLLIWGGGKTWSFFHPEPAKPATVAPAAPGIPASANRGVVPPPPARPASAPAAPKPADLRTPQEKYLAGLSDKGRIRLAGMMDMRGQVTGVVEWLDGGTHVTERTTFDQLRALGVKIEVIHQAALLRLGDWQALATPWPLESPTKVSEERQNVIRGGEDTTPMQVAQVQPQRQQRTVPMPEPAQDSYSQGLAARNAQVRSIFEKR